MISMKKQEITIVDLPVQYVLGLRERGKYHEKIPDMIRRLFEYLGASNIECTGALVFVCRGPADIEIAAREIMRLQEIIRNVLAKHTGQTVEKITHDTDRDFYLNPEQAMEYGIIDEILTRPAEQ